MLIALGTGGAGRRSLPGHGAELRHVLDRYDHLDLHRLAMAGVHDRHGSRAVRGLTAEEARDLLQGPLGRRQADPLRWLARAIASRRSSESARWAPRFVPASAWISSTITQRTPRSALAGPRREHQVQRLGRRDQDVGRPGRRACAVRAAGVSPVRIATAGSCTCAPSRSAASSIPASGARRFFSTSTASARSGEM